MLPPLRGWDVLRYAPAAPNKGVSGPQVKSMELHLAGMALVAFASGITAKKNIKTKALAGAIIIFAALALTVISYSWVVGRGTLIEIITMSVAHRSSTYIMVFYGVAIGLAVKLIVRQVQPLTRPSI